MAPDDGALTCLERAHEDGTRRAPDTALALGSQRALAGHPGMPATEHAPGSELR